MNTRSGSSMAYFWIQTSDLLTSDVRCLASDFKGIRLRSHGSPIGVGDDVLLALGFRRLASGFWLLASGFWLLASGFWLQTLNRRHPHVPSPSSTCTVSVILMYHLRHPHVPSPSSSTRLRIHIPRALSLHRTS